MTHEEMFLWLKFNKISIIYHEPMKFYMQDGKTFICDFYLTDAMTRYGSFPTLEEAIINAAAIRHERELNHTKSKLL